MQKGVFHSRLKEYGLVIVDECHHSASSTGMVFQEKIVSPVTAAIMAYVTSTCKPWLACHGFNV